MARNILTHDRFKILQRDSFTCLYCGSRPGNDNLEVDHLIPYSFGGSDNATNLVSSCVKCNRGKSNGIYMPDSMIVGKDDAGWNIHKMWGIWSIKFSEEIAVVSGSFTGNPCRTNDGLHEYWFDFDRVHERDWEPHIYQKNWPAPHSFGDFISCLSHARSMQNP